MSTRNYVRLHTLTGEKVLIRRRPVPAAALYFHELIVGCRETRLFAGHVLPDVFRELENLFAPETARHTFHNASVYTPRARNVAGESK